MQVRLNMDEHFEYFLNKMGPALARRLVPSAILEMYRHKLPAQLLDYWTKEGWCGYADGLFWTVNPQEYEPVLDAWIGETSFMEHDAYHVIARTAFGGLFLWGETTGYSLKIFAPGAFCVPRESRFVGDKQDVGVQIFFESMRRAGCDFDGMFAPALKALGPLQHDEMYGFVPALALGGAATLAHLKKVKAVEHLVLLAQLAPLQVLNAPSA